MPCPVLPSVCCQLLLGQAYLNAKVLPKCWSELLTQWHVYFLCCLARSVKRCMTTLRTAAKETIVMYACFGFNRMNNVRDNRQASRLQNSRIFCERARAVFESREPKASKD